MWLRPRRNINFHLPWILVLATVSASSPAWAQEANQGFEFGSYGRGVAGNQSEGNPTEDVQVVSHGPRLLESSYAELDFSYIQAQSNESAVFRTQLTLGLGEELFHFSGDFDSDIAIRNLYLEAGRLGLEGLSVWVGSRMYRGDDIYLLDFWPLDEQNTVGGGFAMKLGSTDLRLHIGLNRLNDEYQVQEIEVTGDDLSTRNVLFLSRQRRVVTLRAEHHLAPSEALGLKLIAYGEGHHLPEGVYREADLDELILPEDSGWLVGLELGLYAPGSGSFANLFLRYGTGLGAYDELAIPHGLNMEKTTSGATELLVGFSGNLELGSLGLMSGAYIRSFEDADPNIYDLDDRWEMSAVLRPAWYLTDSVHLIGEVSVQYLHPNGLSTETREHETPMVTQLALMPSISLGRGSYSRPQLRIVYAMTQLNTSAQLTYAKEDPRRALTTQHYIGIGAEWWFNSTRY